MSDDNRLVLQTILDQEKQRTAPKMAADKFFEVFTAEQILKSRSFDLDSDQIRSGILGGGSDGGVDSFYFFVNRKLVREDTDISTFKGQQLAIELVIVQSKGSPSFGEQPLLKFKDFADNVLRLSADPSKASAQLYSQSLKDAVARFHEAYRAVVKSPHPKRPTIATLELDRFTDPMLSEWLEVVVKQYADLGGDDKAAKGPHLSEALKQELQRRFGKTSANTRAKNPDVI